MKDTDDHIRHPRGHLGDRASAQGTRGCAWRDDLFGRGQNTVLRWSDPTFAHGSVPKVTRGSLQPNQGNRASDCSVFCPGPLRELICKTDETIFPLAANCFGLERNRPVEGNVSFLRGKNG
jgi:hypothetical protein